MKKSNKKFIASLLAISIAAPVFSGIPVFAENSDGTIVDQTQPLTVVGKRITGDDTYFEISLEVNGDYDEYSSVGVVLRYDPDYIIPAESWDEDAGAADMSENTSWATRRALPTLGLETWSTHTALAYQEDTAAPLSGGKKYGYLYLGAEHPLGVETPAPDPSASPDPTADPSAPTPEPTASPTPGTRPVVVARFMYKTDAAAEPPVTGKDTREKLENDWLNGANGLGAAEPSNWDYDWTSNAILTIADDDVAGKSPAQYPFAIYTQDYEEKAYMHTWPAVATPTPTASPAVSPTPMPVSAYAPVIGAGIDTANRLTKDDIMVITCVGESAKAQGGLKLSDIYTIVFFDWDDSLLGILTAAVGVPMTEAVDNYIQSKFVHPELRDVNHGGTIDYTSIAPDIWTEDWLARKYSYRGEYPYDAPNTNPTEPGGPNARGDDLPAKEDPSDPSNVRGSSFPITNKLEYSLAGKGIDPEHPFACGWTQVINDEYDWWEIQGEDYDSCPGDMPDFMPHSFENTWTALSYGDSFGRMYFDEDGYVDWDYEYADWYSDHVAIDFDNITADKLQWTDGNLYVKAVYAPNENINYGGNANYAAYGVTDDNQPKISTLGAVSAELTTLSIEFQYKRINTEGYGVSRVEEPSVEFSVKQVGASGSTPIKLDVKNSDTIDVQLTPTNFVQTVGYQLKNIYKLDIVSGGTCSAGDEFGKFELQGSSGLLFQFNLNKLLGDAIEYARGTQTPPTTWLDPTTLQVLLLSRTVNGADYTSAIQARQAQQPLINLLQECEAAGADYKSLTWYQLQWALLRDTVDPSLDYYLEDGEAYDNFYNYGLEDLLEKADMW